MNVPFFQPPPALTSPASLMKLMTQLEEESETSYQASAQVFFSTKMENKNPALNWMNFHP